MLWRARKCRPGRQACLQSRPIGVPSLCGRPLAVSSLRAYTTAPSVTSGTGIIEKGREFLFGAKLVALVNATF
jgi:hypothetical protein